MLSDEEIQRRNHFIRDAIAGNSDFHIGAFHLNIYYLTYHLENTPFLSAIHTHPYWELSFAVNGKIEYQPIGPPQEKITLKGGKKRYVMIPPRQKHLRRNENPIMIFGFMLTVTGNSPETDRALYEKVCSMGFRLKARNGKIEDLEKVLAGEDTPARRAEALLRIRLWLLEIFEDNFGELLNQIPSTKTTRSVLPAAENYIAENLGNDLNVSKIASLCGLSRRQLYRYFEHEFGMPVNQFILQRRLQFAAGELSSTSRPVKEIAMESGFSNMSYFSRCFRKRYGATPSAFRTPGESG